MSTNKLIKTARGEFFVRDTANQGFPVVFLHGWPESSYSWEALLPFMDKKFRLIRPDLRGLGDSERTPDVKAYTKQELAKDMLSLLEVLEIKEFALVGHDWGGIVAQEMAFLVPERIKNLCLLNISIINNLKGIMAAQEEIKKQGYNSNWYQTFMQQEDLPEAMITGNEEIWLKNFLRFSHKKEFTPHLFQEIVRTFKIPETAKTSSNYYRAMYADAQRWMTLGGTKHPISTLFIYGKRDIVIIPAYLQFADECFEAFRIAEFDAGHFVQDELPQEVGMEINPFLAHLIEM